nr:reverse transcriptase domain-containing protein [Tanacetum cinerariifolium]
EEAFKQTKQLIVELSMLTAPMEKEELIVYLAASKETILSRPEVAGRLQKWSIELREYAIHYRPRVSVKGQILADFIVERPEEDSSDTPMEEEELPEPWIFYGPILLHRWFRSRTNTYKPRRDEIQLRFKENVDSRLVANQVNGTYVAKEADMIRYLKKVKALAGSFKAFSIKQIPRSENKKADALSKIASTSFVHLSKKVLVEELKEKSISEIEILAVVEEEGDTWMTPLFKYLAEGTLPTYVKKAREIRCKSRRPRESQILNSKAMDYFTKWIEAKPVATITGNQIKKFMWDNIVCMFRLPGEIISDNGKQFRDDPFKEWCKKLCIRQHFSSVKHPQTNGLVETTNRNLGDRIKASNEDTPFSLTYETEAVIPAEIGMPTLKTTKVDLVGNNEALEINLDLLEEKREEAAIREAKSKAKIEKYYNSKKHQRHVDPGSDVWEPSAGQREAADKLDTDLVEIALHMEERFNPHLLTTISRRRWLLTHGLELAIAKCLNYTKYLFTLEAAIGKAVVKGMQDGLSTGITHGAEGKVLTDVVAYNPSAEADYLSAFQCLQSVNFSL